MTAEEKNRLVAHWSSLNLTPLEVIDRYCFQNGLTTEDGEMLMAIVDYAASLRKEVTLCQP